MSIAARDFTVGGETYSLLYNARARWLFERASGYPLGDLKSFRGSFSDVELVHLLVAGLEGHRLRSEPKAKPWTADRVLDDLIGDCDATDRAAIYRGVMEAHTAAFEGLPEPDETADDDAEGNAAETS